MLQSMRLAAIPATLILSGCATTAFQSTWKAPDAQPVNYTGKKVVAVVSAGSEANRRAAEQALAEELTKRGAVGIPAYTLIPDDEVEDKEKSKAALEKAGAAGAVVMNFLGRAMEISMTPNTTYVPRYLDSSQDGYVNVNPPGHIPVVPRADTVVRVETLVYNVEQDKLIWAGTSNTSTYTASVIKEVAAAAAKEMKKAGLFTK